MSCHVMSCGKLRRSTARDTHPEDTIDRRIVVDLGELFLIELARQVTCQGLDNAVLRWLQCVFQKCSPDFRGLVIVPQ